MLKLEFNPSDPFPQVHDVEYLDEKEHAAAVDAWLGLRTDFVEANLRDLKTGREFWIGKPVQTFSTPYTELRGMLEELQPSPGQTVVDLGAGYGRLAHVLGRHFQHVRFVGFEFVRERQIEGQTAIERAGLKNAQLVCADVTTVDFRDDARADFYFLYDFGSREDVEIAVDKLKEASLWRAITVIARGGRSRDIIEKQHPWLSQVVTPMHRRHYSIYRSAE